MGSYNNDPDEAARERERDLQQSLDRSAEERDLFGWISHVTGATHSPGSPQINQVIADVETARLKITMTEQESPVSDLLLDRDISHTRQNLIDWLQGCLSMKERNDWVRRLKSANWRHELAPMIETARSWSDVRLIEDAQLLYVAFDRQATRLLEMVTLEGRRKSDDAS